MTNQAQGAQPELPGKPTSASRTTLSHIMTGSDTNLLGTVHGGVIMKLVDDAAGAVAGRHSEGPAVTASMDEMAFLEPVRVGDLVHVKAQVNWTGRSSMEIGVRVLAERWNESTPATQVGSAYLVFAAVDADGKPRPVPPVIPETERDKRRYQEAEIRRTHRLARRRAIKELRAQRATRRTESAAGAAGAGGAEGAAGAEGVEGR
ncbi:acyl-CoA thioesterase [Streptomyces hygroscopicus]|uniref:acyl-CoA thioesterase n=1 Tax=Streptomyces hygroscopicus TaxID=1912 RepID=UPI000AF58354|nr:acyl-CoA thioesterase [Streptomyces hygroscopicus]GLV79896.1 acyl-CoA thioesterase [Streptomyces hygroscopicus subsp. hygroscopicus]